jgi:hypothetical protein
MQKRSYEERGGGKKPREKDAFVERHIGRAKKKIRTKMEGGCRWIYACPLYKEYADLCSLFTL